MEAHLRILRLLTGRWGIFSTVLMSMIARMNFAQHLNAKPGLSELPNPVDLRSIVPAVKDDLNPPRVVLILCA